MDRFTTFLIYDCNFDETIQLVSLCISNSIAFVFIESYSIGIFYSALHLFSVSMTPTIILIDFNICFFIHLCYNKITLFGFMFRFARENFTLKFHDHYNGSVLGFSSSPPWPCFFLTQKLSSDIVCIFR